MLNRQATAEQIRLASRIDVYVKGIQGHGGGDEEILSSMEPMLIDFGALMTSTNRAQMDQLADQYSGFRDFSVLLTRLAAGIKDGRVQVPR